MSILTVNRVVLCVALLGVSGACGGARKPYATTGGALQLSKVVLYRNGVGYFERGGRVDGNLLTIRVRKDQVNDLLKSLTVVERSGGRAVSISMPLDPRAWANAAIATLGPGSGSLAEVLDKLRGTPVTLRTRDDSVSGRVLIVEAIQSDGSPSPREGKTEDGEQDYKVTLIDDERLHVVRLSKVVGITIHNDDISLQFKRSLDATAGEGMFQQVDVTIRLAGKSSHDLLVSYVVGAPMWKPTYRVVLPENGKGQALLQGWAVVDNTTGEDWTNVKLSLTSGAPIAFRYDLHTPRDVLRTDLSSVGSSRRARAAVGETGYADQPPPPPQSMPSPAPAPSPATESRYDRTDDAKVSRGGRAGASPKPSKKLAPSPRVSSTPMAPAADRDEWGGEQETAVNAEELARSMTAQTQAANVSGLSRYDLGERLTVPDGTSTMVAIINQKVAGEETFLYRPGGAGQGYESNPYRVIRFKNSTPFALESGPISIYSGGSFVGEGISEPVSAGVPVTIPFAVESGLMVSSRMQSTGDEMRLVKIVRGVIEVETFARRTTAWEVKSQLARTGETTLYVRHPKAGGSFQLAPRPPGAEDLADAYLIPIKIAGGAAEAKLEVVEQTPSRTTLSIWDARALVLFEGILAQGNLDRGIRQKLEPIVKLRQEVGRIDTEIEGKARTRAELDQRAEETRSNLEAIKRDPAAGALRKRLSDRLEQFAKDGDKLGRDLVELQTKRTEKKVALEDAMQNLELAPAQPLAPKN